MKQKTQYVCQSCGYSSAKWLGRCQSCNAWNSMVEERADSASGAAVGSLGALREELRGSLVPFTPAEIAGASGLEIKPARGSKSRASNTGKSEGWISPALSSDAPLWVALEEEHDEGVETPQHLKRFSTGMAELDRVLGGGLVPDSFTLLGGDPGIGKSTLLLQMAKGLLEKNPNLRILYVSGEESVDQIRGRAHRLGVTGKKAGKNSEGANQVFLAAETQLEKVFSIVKELQPHVMVMDSLQTFATQFLDSSPGSVSQVREVTARLMTLAKTAGISVWIVGHVTKEGSIAGPKTVEHMVDTVLYFEGEGAYSYRLLRAVKNRFGSSRELGVFEMSGEGLEEVPNPSALFLSERKVAVAGTAITASMEGSRPLLIEVQALVSRSPLAMPRRTAVGMDGQRISLLAAILERHMELTLANQDLFFNVAGGMKLSEPACDLAAAAAIWSSYMNQPLPQGTVFLGEVGLTGEVRRISLAEARLEEAAKLGFKRVVMPQSSLGKLSAKSEMELIGISKVSDLAQLFK